MQNVFMLSDIILRVVMRSDIILTIVMLSDVMLSVKAPIFAVKLMFPFFKTNSKLGWGEP